MAEGEQIVCVYCNRIETEELPTEIDVVTRLPIHKGCFEKWMKLSGIQKRIRIRLYKLAEEADESPSYYHGLDVAENEFLGIVEEIKNEIYASLNDHLAEDWKKLKNVKEDIKKWFGR